MIEVDGQKNRRIDERACFMQSATRVEHTALDNNMLDILKSAHDT